jgi:hypothetical protein
MHIAMQGYKAQSEMVLESLDKLIGACEARRESMVVEGVHLSLNAVIRLMQKHPSIVPFLVHISNEAKHRERFAVGICSRILVPRLQCVRKENTVLLFIQPNLWSRGYNAQSLLPCTLAPAPSTIGETSGQRHIG